MTFVSFEFTSLTTKVIKGFCAKSISFVPFVFQKLLLTNYYIYMLNLSLKH